MLRLCRGSFFEIELEKNRLEKTYPCKHVAPLRE
jgi:hypothetical protein